mmetsp:Transcript_73096/g.152602  ORF Transcript_73096/g.152602 Transcript_73096/m.152602 type:complete len:126 (-) Transcript_73096:60-437(-)
MAMVEGNMVNDVEDVLPDNLFIRVVHGIAWLLTVLLTAVSFGFICYQLYALYIPYSKAKLLGDTEYRFPEYFYRVWGNDAVDLTSEHWGYLGACTLVTFLSVKYVVPYHPFERRPSDSGSHAKAD